MNSPHPQKNQTTVARKLKLEIAEMPDSVAGLVDFLQRHPTMAKEKIREKAPALWRYRDRELIERFPLYFVVIAGGTSQQVQEVYDLFPQALELMDSAKLLDDACGKGVACEVLQFLTQKVPGAVSEDCFRTLIDEHNGTSYPLARALGILLDIRPYKMETAPLCYSLLGYALMNELPVSMDVIVLLVDNTVKTNAIGKKFHLTDGDPYTDAYNICANGISPSLACALSPLLTTATDVTLGVNTRDIEGCTAVLDCLALSPVLQEISLCVEVMPNQATARRWGVSLRKLLVEQKTLRSLCLEFDWDENGGNHDLVIQELFEARHFLSPRLNKLNVRWPESTKTAELTSLLVGGYVPNVVLENYCALDIWEEPQSLPTSSKTRELSFEGRRVSESWTRGCLCFISQQMPSLESLKMNCEVSGCYNGTAEVVSLLQRGNLKKLDCGGIILDIESICDSLKINTSLKSLSYYKGDSLPLAEVEFLIDVLQINVTLESVKNGNGASTATTALLWDKINYLTALNRYGRSKVRGSSVSLSQCVSVLCGVAEMKAAPARQPFYETEKMWQQRVSDRDNKQLGMMYGLLHECVGICSLAL